MLPVLNRIGDRTTAFNLAAIFAVLASFAVYNLQEAIAGRWELAPYDPPISSTDFRKVIGFFAMVQGFEASRYLGARFSGELRIKTMRFAQVVSTAVFVALIALALLLFATIRPAPNATAIFVISKAVSPHLPWLILLAALGSQLSAITNATSSRSDLLIEATHGTIALEVHRAGPARAGDDGHDLRRRDGCRGDRIARVRRLLPAAVHDRGDDRLADQELPGVRRRVRCRDHARHRHDLRPVGLTSPRQAANFTGWSRHPPRGRR